MRVREEKRSPPQTKSLLKSMFQEKDLDKVAQEFDNQEEATTSHLFYLMPFILGFRRGERFTEEKESKRTPYKSTLPSFN